MADLKVKRKEINNLQLTLELRAAGCADGVTDNAEWGLFLNGVTNEKKALEIYNAHIPKEPNPDPFLPQKTEIEKRLELLESKVSTIESKIP
jgi:hypothetical protein